MRTEIEWEKEDGRILAPIDECARVCYFCPKLETCKCDGNYYCDKCYKQPERI